MLKQTYTDLHLVIVDDGSTDPKMIEVLEKYGKDSRITIIRNKENMGIAYSLNLGIEQAANMPSVKYIARMDSDDISLKDRILTQVQFMERNPSIDVCGTAMIILRQNAEPRVVCMPTHD